MAARSMGLEASASGYGSMPTNGEDDATIEASKNSVKCTSNKLFGYAVVTSGTTSLGAASGTILGTIFGAVAYASYEAEGKNEAEAELVWKVSIGAATSAFALLGFLYGVYHSFSHRNDR